MMAKSSDGRYCKNVEQAKKRVHEKKHPWYGKMQWCITECTRGFLVSSAAQAKMLFSCIPRLSAVCDKTTKSP
jgi:hypothetical protein